MTEDIVLSYRNTEPYQALVEECQAILVQRIKNSREEVILAYGQIGERIYCDPLYEKYEKGNQEFVKNLAEDIGISYSEAQRAIQFYRKFGIVSPDSENWSKFKEGENISWNKIKQLYLPSGKEEHEHLWERIERWRCSICGSIRKEKP